VKIDVTTVAIAAGAAYFLLSRKSDDDGEGAVTFDIDPVDTLKGDCPPGFSPTPQGFCLPDDGQDFDLPGADPVKSKGYGIDGGIAPAGEPSPDPGFAAPAGLAAPGGGPGGQGLAPTADYEYIMATLTPGDATPGGFYQVRQGDKLNTLAKYALRKAATYAAELRGADQSTAQALGNAAANQWLVAYREAIQCSPFNDSLYAEWAYPASALPGPGGRALRLRPKHFDNFALMSAGEAPARNVRWGLPSDPVEPRVSSRAPRWQGEDSYSLLWLPGVNVDAMVTEQLQLGELLEADWPNSVWTQIVPPPAILELGFVDHDDENAPGQIGCKNFVEDYPGG